MLDLITQKVFTKGAVQYLIYRVNEILAQPRNTKRDSANQELERARRDLENIKSAIRQGSVTATTKAMLEETEARVAQAEAAVREADLSDGKLAVLPALIEHHLRDLQSVVGKEPDRARVILQKLIGDVTLQPNKEGLEAVLRGNVPGILNLDERYCTTGAGSPFLTQPNRTLDRITLVA